VAKAHTLRLTQNGVHKSRDDRGLRRFQRGTGGAKSRFVMDPSPEFPFADDLGPAKVVHIYDPATALKAVVVVDNVARGPAIGGARMATDVTSTECFRLARAMTLKNAAAGLAHGGGKSVIMADPRMPRPDKERLVRAFARAIRSLDEYIVGPDMGTDETCMAWVHDEIGRSVGLPREIGGIPLDEIGATGWGVRHSVEVAAEVIGLKLDGARLAVQGFGAVGQHTARFLAELGAVLVAAADSRGTVSDPKGLDVDALIAIKARGGSVFDYRGGDKSGVDAILDVPCDVWVPAARPDVLREDNTARLQARIVAQGANIPATPVAERMLHERGVVSLPDFIANAGGVICAALEYRGATERAAFDTIAEKIRDNTRAVLTRSRSQGTLPREAAVALATERVKAAMAYRR
jgi:glutamate dehydrogenase (NAD(P)+)